MKFGIVMYLRPPQLMGRSVGLSVCLPAKYCGETADWIQMPFAAVRGIGRGMGVLEGVVIVEGEGAVLG